MKLSPILSIWAVMLHQFLENNRYGMVGDDGACPYFWAQGSDAELTSLDAWQMGSIYNEG